MRFNINRMGEQINFVAGLLLQQITTTHEWGKIKKLKVGERIEAGDSDEQKAAVAYMDQRAMEDAEDRRTRRYEDGDYSY